ncbi:UNVERIFIED_CONTAM: hypothetical protein H355_004437 [Colinus virginianus]|nr:hypothetical protein H355_004437 [Colinus virginianus]
MLAVLVAAASGLLLLLLLHRSPFLRADLGAFLSLLLSSLRCRWRLSRRPPLTLLQVFQSHARRRPRHPLLLFGDEVYTYGDVERRSNRAGRALARRVGLKPGQTVAVFLPNVPAYVWTWLALAKLGCSMACLNCNVRGRALLHARSAARADVVLSCCGATCALRTKFSASQFWDDCRRYNVTVIQYVGELMRYLCNSPKRDNDREHSVRLAIGNGLRATVWKEFVQRFGPISICEFYGATEGNAGFINYTGKIGAVGRANDVLEITGTFKQCKGNLVQEGFDPNVVTDPLYFRDDKKKSYVPMNSDIYAKILDGSLSL